MHKIIKASDYRIMPWKNGLGTTVEIAIEPADAKAGGDFNWRLSVATIGASGPFSAFPGYDRVLVPLSGGTVELHHGNAAGTSVLKPFEPYLFKGEWETQCNLDAEVARDFNVMTKRSWGKAQVDSKSLASDEKTTIASAADYFFIFCIDAPLRFQLPNMQEDSILDTEESLTIVNPQPGNAFKVEVKNGQRIARFLSIQLFSQK